MTNKTAASPGFYVQKVKIIMIQCDQIHTLFLNFQKLISNRLRVIKRSIQKSSWEQRFPGNKIDTSKVLSEMTRR